MTTYYFQYPIVFIIYLGLIALLLLLTAHDFVKFKTKEEQHAYKQSRKKLRVYIIVSRIVIFLLVAGAIASPYTFNRITIPGNPSLTILEDKSHSFDIFEQGIGERLKNELEKKFPVIKRDLVIGNNSEIGNAILNNMQGNDHLLLITDWNNNEGKDLNDMMYFAASINTTISYIALDPIKNDLVVSVSGVSEAIVGSESTFYVDVKQAGEPLSYSLVVKIDGNIEIDTSGKGTNSYTIGKRLSEGYHKIEAKISAQDYFKENNEFYKSVRVYPKPKLLLISRDDSLFESVIHGIYDIEKADYMPNDLTPYLAIIVDNSPADSLNPHADRLTEYISNGNGLIVLGGESSFDKGSYKNSIIETLLPVQVGKPETKKATSNLNIVVVIDVSGTTKDFVTSSLDVAKLDLQKALAIDVIKGLRQDDNVAVVAFDKQPYLISPLSRLGDKPELTNTIAKIKSRGGNTVMYGGLKAAETMLNNTGGVNFVIFVSDGIVTNQHDEQNTFALAEKMAKNKMSIYTVRVGDDPRGIPFLNQLALKSNGVPISPKALQGLDLHFKRPDKPPTGISNLIITDAEHFITKPVNLKAAVTGFNEVYQKPNARMLVSTEHGYPILTVWRYGLGRVAVISTDSGLKWNQQLMSTDNYQTITRMVNWAIGDPNRNKDFDVKVKDVNLGKHAEIIVVSKKPFSSENPPFYKIGENVYKSTLMPSSTGFQEFFGAVMAVNYNKEYSKTGMNPDRPLVGITGGKVFKQTETDAIAEFVKEASRREKNEIQYFRWPLLIAALFLFLTEIGVRRIFEK